MYLVVKVWCIRWWRCSGVSGSGGVVLLGGGST